MALEVLVVDDEADIRELVSGVLEDEGYSVALARDGNEALEKARDLRPGLILLDVVLPKVHRVLVPTGRFLVWRNVFGDASVSTPFRERVAEIVHSRDESQPRGSAARDSASQPVHHASALHGARSGSGAAVDAVPEDAGHRGSC